MHGPSPTTRSARAALALLAALLLLAFASAARAEERVALLSASFSPAAAAAGETVTLSLAFRVVAGDHVYAAESNAEAGLPASLSLAAEPARLSPVGPLVGHPVEVKYDEIFEVDVHLLHGDATFEQRYEVDARAPPGAVTLAGTLHVQVCDESTCENLDLPFEAPLEILAPRGPPAAGADGAATGTEGDASAAGGSAARLDGAAAKPPRGFFTFLLAAVGAALLALMTPCVFPMIPITVSVFSKDAGGSRSRSVSLALVYSLGIVLTFTALGLITAVLVGPSAANALAANPWVNLGLTALFVVFGLSLLGAFEIRLPNFLIHGAADLQQRQTGYLAVLLMGFVFTLTSFTCTVQFVGLLLVEAAKGDVLWPVVGMLAFSITFALPFFFLALFPRALRALPQAGGWMNAVKVTMGLIELAAALKFASNADIVWDAQVLTRTVFLGAWVAIFAVTTLYLLGLVKIGYDAGEGTIGVGRLAAALLFGFLTVYVASGFTGRTLDKFMEAWLPPPGYGESAPLGAGGAGAVHEAGVEIAGGLPFFQDYHRALAAARRERQPLFLDFTGVTCVNCRAMEVKVFPRPEVRAQLERFVRAQLWVDKGGNAEFNQDLQVERFGVSAQPFYVVLDPFTEREIARYEGFANTRAMELEFVERLKAAADAFAEGRE